MARIQLVVSPEDRERFFHGARQEGMTLSAWLRAAAHDRIRERHGAKTFETKEELDEFFRACDAIPGPDREPDWEEHLAVIEKSKAAGAAKY